MTSGGQIGGWYQPLSQADIKKMHNIALDLLAEVGVEVHSPQARGIFAAKGAWVNHHSRIVKFPRSLVEDAIASAPSRVLLAGRDPKHDLILEGTRTYLGTGGTTIYVLDLDGQKRLSTLQDNRDIARLVDALDDIHFIVIPTYPNDIADKAQVDVNRYYATMSNTTKHVQSGPHTMKGLRNIIKMAEIISGGPEAYRERPICSFIVCLISPFVMDVEFTDLIIEIARQGLPVSLSVEPLSGATAPVTLAGHLTQWAAEVLAGVTLVQCVNPGSPCLVGYVGTITDLRTMNYLCGAVEQGLLNAAVAQFSNFWHIPCYATSGMSDSKCNDAQTGYEGAMTSLMAALAGANFIHDAAGLMEFAMVASYEKYVIDNEIIGMVMRAVRGIETDEEAIAADVIRAVGPAGNYLAEPHTVRHMRQEFFFPLLSDRQKREDWEAAGSKTTRQRANEIARQILAEHQPQRWPDKIDAMIRAEIPDII